MIAVKTFFRRVLYDARQMERAKQNKNSQNDH